MVTSAIPVLVSFVHQMESQDFVLECVDNLLDKKIPKINIMNIFCISSKQLEVWSYAGKFTPRLDQSNSEILNDLIKQKKK